MISPSNHVICGSSFQRDMENTCSNPPARTTQMYSCFCFFRANNSDIPLADPIAVVTIDPPNRSADWNLSWLATKPCQTQWNIYDATTARNRQTHYVARAFSTMPRAYRQLPNNQPPKWTRPTRQIR